MFSKGKGQPPMPSEVQAKEKLVIYVYEYLMNQGAKNSAQTFLNEIRWDKNVPLSSEHPGFLVSWWSVFWDLYCAANPERRDQGEPTSEAKMFHEFTQNPQPPQLANNNLMGPGPNPPFQRFHSAGPPGPRPVRMPSNMDFNNVNPNNNQMNNDQSRVPPGIQSPLSRLTPPGRMNQVPAQQQQPQVGPPQPNQMNQFNGAGGPSQLRGNPNQPPPPQQMQSNPPMSPMSMAIQQQQQQQQQQQRWTATPNSQAQSLPPPPPPPPPHNIGYTSSSPVSYGNVSINHHGGPGTPIIPSPQEQNPDINFNMIKNVGNNIQFHDQNMAHIVPINTDVSHHSHMANEMIDTIKHSPLPNLSGNRHPDDHSVGGPVAGQVVGPGGVGPPPMNDLNAYNNFADGVNLF